jgi:ketosteroid isomerase-like protein
MIGGKQETHATERMPREGPRLRAQVRTIVEALYASWAAKDLTAVLDCCTDDIVFALHIPTDVAPFAGESCGKGALAPRLKQILDAFEFLDYRPLLITAIDGDFHAQIHYHYRHKATGHEIDGTMRHIGRLAGDKLARLDEYHDTPRVRAFLELLALSADEARQRTFPNITRNR